MKLLIVDDAKAVHGFIRSSLGDDYEYLSAFDGDEALATLTEHPDIQLVLLDWEMPTKDGLETLKDIRQRGLDVPVIMVTSVNQVDHITQALSSGANEYVMKPFTREILAEKIATVGTGDKAGGF